MVKPIKIRERKVIDIKDDTVAIVEGDSVRLNQLDPMGDQKYDYDSVYLSVKDIIELAEKLKPS